MTTVSPPISPQGQDARPRAHTALSFSSQRSRRSSSATNKVDTTENTWDKKRLNTKADPTRALNEATPAEQAQEQSTVEDIRLIMHKDGEGNVITDPDRSNPTRHRLERPLDTIRSFNAAAEGTSSRRSSFNRPTSQVGFNGDTNRRASYYSNSGYSPQRPRPPPGPGYYRNSSYGFGPQSSVEEAPGSAQMYGRNVRQHSTPYYGPPGGPPNGLQNGYQNGHQNGYQNGYHNGESPTSGASYQQSYETMTSGSEDYGKSTNPSSQNSSFDQLHQLHQLRKHDDFGGDNPYANEIRFNQVPPNKPFAPSDLNNGHYGPATASPPPVPGHSYAPNNPRQAIKLNGPSSDDPDAGAGAVSPTSGKRQSWIKRRFSRRDN